MPGSQALPVGATVQVEQAERRSLVGRLLARPTGIIVLMRAVGRLFGNRPYHFHAAGIVISWAAFVVAMVLLYRVARLDLSRRAAF